MTALETLIDTENAIPVASGTQNRIVRVLLVDDHQVVREGLKRILEMEWSIKVVGEAGNGEEAIVKASALVPDVVVMDLKMPGMDGISATREIKKRLPDVSVLMLTLYAEDFVREAIEAGASGYLLKDCDCEQIIKAIYQTCDGLCPIAPSLTKDLVARLNTPRTGADGDLTTRQKEILRCIADGVSGEDIAAKLFVSLSTVKRDIGQILQKLGAADRAQAISQALKRKIIS